MEKAGIPAVAIITDPFRETGVEMAKNWGVPDYRFLEMPHPIANLTVEELNNRVDNILEEVLTLLKEGQTSAER